MEMDKLSAGKITAAAIFFFISRFKRDSYPEINLFHLRIDSFRKVQLNKKEVIKVFPVGKKCRKKIVDLLTLSFRYAEYCLETCPRLRINIIFCFGVRTFTQGKCKSLKTSQCKFALLSLNKA